MLEQIIFRFCQVFVPPSLTRTDLNILPTSPESYTQSPLPGPSKYLFWQTSSFLLLTESLASRSQASDFPLLLRLEQEENQSDQKDWDCTHYIIRWKEEVGPSDGFCSKLLTLWREPVTCSRSKRLQFSVSCLLRKYKFYFYLKLSVSSSRTVPGPGQDTTKEVLDLLPPATSWATQNWWEKFQNWQLFHIKKQVEQFIFYFECINWSWWCLTILLKFSNVIINYNF